VLELDDGPQSAVHVENHTVLDVSGRSHASIDPFDWECAAADAPKGKFTG
jgi:hypothetical protein